MIEFPPFEIMQILLGILLGIIGWNVRQALNKIDDVAKTVNTVDRRVIKIETRLGIDNGEQK